MSNIFLLPSNFTDGNNQSPPANWNAVTGYYEFNGNFIPNTITLTNSNEPVQDDVVAFSFYGATVPPSTLRVDVNGVQAYLTQLEAGIAYNFSSGPLEPTDVVLITLTFTTADHVIDARLRPLANEESGGAVVPDTYTLKAFMGYGVFSRNAPYEVADIGELSAYGITFAKDRELFSTVTEAPDSTSVNLTVFTSADENDVHVSPPTQYSETILEIGRWIYTNAFEGNFTVDPEVFRDLFLAEFAGTIYAPTIGPMVAIPGYYFPESISFFINPDSYGVTWPPGVDYLTRSRIKIWFSDAAFTSQYDETQIDNIPPLADLDDFFRLANLVEADVNARTIPQLTDLIQSKAAKNPFTLAKALNFTYHDPLNSTNTFETTWTFLIYGPAGDNVDVIKAQLIEWILNNSTHTQEEWAEIFPDIFTSTEFIITPIWNQFAVPNLTLSQSVYSPIVNHTDAGEIALSTGVGTDYTDEHVRNVLAIAGCPYKSIAFLAVGGPRNRNNVFRFEKQWPDYMSVPTSSLDFNRMSPTTQGWIMLLYQLLQVAETATEFSDLPVGLTRLKRTNSAGQEVLYISASYQSVQYLVVAKSWLNRNFPPANPDPGPLTVLPNIPTLATPINSQTLVRTFTASGGRAPYSFTASSANLVSGGINSVTGVFNGTFNIWGTAVLRIEVSDADDVVIARNYAIDIVGS